MADVTPCPEPEILGDLLANRLPTADAERIRAHLADCQKCQSRLRSTAPAPVSPRPSRFSFLRPPVEPSDLGVLGEYRVVGVLGEGGMSIVFDAEEPILHRRVALKTLRPENNDGVTRERFLREARALASLPPQHVVHVYSVGEDNGIPFMAMECLRGETLASRLERDRWLPVADALRIAREAAEGLVVLHERGIIHRDIKPDNLWLESGTNGRFDGVKLIDFGIARSTVSGDSGLTLPGQIVGTPVYMSSEQAAGRPLDGRTDIYSLGCVLYKMVTGLTPFDSAGPKTMLVLEAVIKGNAPKIREAAPHLSPPVAELIQQLMENDPNKRPASASVVVERLRILEDQQRNRNTDTKTIAAFSDPATRRAPRRAGLIGIIAGAIAVFAAVAVGVLAIIHRYSTSDTPPIDQEEFKVGVLFSQHGTTAPLELPMIDAIQLAIDEINDNGGVMGRKVRAVLADGNSEEGTFAARAEQLIDDDKVEVIFGGWSSGSRKRMGEVCQDRDRLLFFPANHEGLDVSPNVIHLGGSANQTVGPLVRYAFADLHRRKFFLVGSESLFSRGINAIYEYEITKRSEAKVVGSRYFLLDERNVADVVEEIRKSEADFIICSIDGATNQSFFSALRDARLRPPLTPTAWAVISETELVQYSTSDVLDDLAAGCYFESLDTPANKAFLANYRKRFGPTKRVNDSMQTAYSGVYLWKKAVEKAKTTDTAQVREALRGMTIDTPDGPLKIDEKNLYAWRTGRVGKVVRAKNRTDFEIVYQSPSPVRPDPFPAWKTPDQWNSFLDKLYKGWGNAWEKHKKP